jgi:superfamily I DNA and/or RNA helicase
VNPIQQLEHLIDLLRIEKEEDARIYRETVLSRSLKERAEKGVSWYPVDLKRMYIGTAERIVLEVSRLTHTDKPHQLQSGSMVSIFGMDGDTESGKASGVIYSIRRNEMKIVLGSDNFPSWMHHVNLGVNLDFDDKTYKEMESALRTVIKGKNKRLAELREVLLGKTEPGFVPHEHHYRNPDLNESQVKAINNILQATDVAIIHGPPGTGKTTTLVHAVAEVLQREEQVLVCAASNTAVDLLAEKCYDLGLRVLRLGNPARVDESIIIHTLDAQISTHPDYPALKKLRREAEEVRKQAMKFKRKFGQDERRNRRDLIQEANELKAHAHTLESYILHHVIRNAEVICCTLTGAASSFLGRRKFNTLFIDEAAQALAPACWIPMQRAGRVIFAGDHCQLPPTVKSMEAEVKGLGRTLFEDLMDRKQVHVMLDVQYRMHEDIMNFSGGRFYEGKLKAAPEARFRGLGPDFQPVEFIDTAGCGFDEQKNEETLSTANPEEARLLLKHLALLLNRIEKEVPDLITESFRIGIISPYKAQVQTLREFLQDSPMLESYKRHISVNTVDGFQGQEREVIYISMVRSNMRGDIGFLKDIRRMNVALTRAKRKLVVVGDSATIAQFPFYQHFIEYVEELNAYKSAWELMGD